MIMVIIIIKCTCAKLNKGKKKKILHGLLSTQMQYWYLCGILVQAK